MEDTIVALNMRAALRNGLEGSSEETSFHDESLQDDREEIENNAYHIHPAGQIHILFYIFETVFNYSNVVKRVHFL